MATRPYIQKTIVDLQALFEASRDNPAELKKLAAELSHRKVPKAEALAKKVSDALKGNTPKSDEPLKKESKTAEPPPPPEDPVIDCQGCGKRLRIKRGNETREFSCPGCKATFQASFSAGVLSVVFVKIERSEPEPPPSDDAPITLKEAYKLFEADENTQWELIELARRKLIQQYHPDKVEALGPKLRAVAESEGKRINVAYDVLRIARGY